MSRSNTPKVKIYSPKPRDQSSRHGGGPRKGKTTKLERMIWRALKVFWVRWTAIVVALALVTYGAWALAINLAEPWILFPAHLVQHRIDDEAKSDGRVLGDKVGVGAKRVAFLHWPDGQRPEEGWPLASFLHGRAETVDYQTSLIRGYNQLGYGVMMPEYRGYGRMANSEPSQEAIVGDVLWALAELEESKGSPFPRLVLHGRSIGAALAVAVAQQRRPDALILETPPRSGMSVMMRYLIPPAWVDNPLPVASALPALSDVPTLIFALAGDEVFPPEAHAEVVRDAAPWARYEVVEKAHVHHDIFPPKDDELMEARWEIIAELLGESASRVVVEGEASTSPDG